MARERERKGRKNKAGWKPKKRMKKRMTLRRMQRSAEGWERDERGRKLIGNPVNRYITPWITELGESGGKRNYIPLGTWEIQLGASLALPQSSSFGVNVFIRLTLYRHVTNVHWPDWYKLFLLIVNSRPSLAYSLWLLTDAAHKPGLRTGSAHAQKEKEKDREEKGGREVRNGEMKISFRFFPLHPLLALFLRNEPVRRQCSTRAVRSTWCLW